LGNSNGRKKKINWDDAKNSPGQTSKTSKGGGRPFRTANQGKKFWKVSPARTEG